MDVNWGTVRMWVPKTLFRWYLVDLTVHFHNLFWYGAAGQEKANSILLTRAKEVITAELEGSLRKALTSLCNTAWALPTVWKYFPRQTSTAYGATNIRKILPWKNSKALLNEPPEWRDNQKGINSPLSTRLSLKLKISGGRVHKNRSLNCKMEEEGWHAPKEDLP